MPDFDSVTEILVYVREMDRMLSFYADVFGLDVAEGAPEHGFVRFDLDGCDLCLHAGAEGDPGRTAPKFVFEVDDAEEARAYLQERGVEVGEVRSPAPGTQVVDGRDPEGNRFSVESSTAPE